MARIERVYHPYWLWEDVGMYQPPMFDMIESGETKEERLSKAVKLLSNPEEFQRVAEKLTKEWKYACEHNLTNSGLNRIAYIGQASCFYAYGIKEEETREAWGYLTEEQQAEANKIAEKVLRAWEYEFKKNNA